MAGLFRGTFFSLAALAVLFCARVAAARPACDFSGLKLGPAFELDIDEKLSVDGARLAASLEGASARFDLDRGGPTRIAEPRRFLLKAGQGAGPASGKTISLTGLGDAPMVLPLANGRNLTIARLYADTFALKVGAQDRAAYRAFGEALLSGKLCGRALSRLPRAEKSKLKPLVAYFLFDALSAGRLDDYAAWVKYAPVFNAFFSRDETVDFLDIYGYRAAQILADHPGKEKIDIYKGWVFAWNAAALHFHVKDAVNFTDVSAYQRDGQVEFALLGSQPIPGGAENRFGFYTKPLGDLDLHGLKDERKYHWDWTQGRKDFSADIAVSPIPQRDKAPRAGFPGGARRGMIVLDVTLSRKEARASLAAYKAYFSSRGFAFAEPKELADAPAFVTNAVTQGDLDYLIRDGHSDGDDDNVVNLYRDGFVLSGSKGEAGKAETIDILYRQSRKPKAAALSYADFAQGLDRRAKTMKNPLVLVDASCWGVEKAWFGLAHAPGAQLMEITAGSPVNFFADSDHGATRIVLDGVLRGARFDALRARLRALPRYADGREDRFIFPNNPRYPRG
ncbi:hypothetical protein, partial [Rhodoblastus sp.]|uniref:hypothetical protein n=1 Tax=Rhodoblastus sp. TaxID=1962975 RepID=UPI003F9E89AC